MADGWGPAAANSALDTFIATYPWVQLHIGAPGAAGTSNPAVETTRQSLAAAMAAASGGTKLSNVLVSWMNVAGSEQYTHVSAWTLAAGGVFGGSGAAVANPVVAGDNFSVPVTQVIAALPLAS